MSRSIFLSYSHRDDAWRDAFREMLIPALTSRGVELWADDYIRVGSHWERRLDDELERADAGLLLVTSAFLASRFCWDVEVPRLLARGVPTTWVLVEECLWEDRRELVALQSALDPSDGALSEDAPGTKRRLAQACRRIRDDLLGPEEEVDTDHSRAFELVVVDERDRSETYEDRGGLADSTARSTTGDDPQEPGFDETEFDAVDVSPLEESSKPGPRHGAIPERPPGFVDRPDLLEAAVRDLIGGETAVVGVAGKASAFGLYGTGGIGKSVLAAEIARDDRVARYFPDGVYWITMGADGDVLDTQHTLLRWLGDDGPQPDDVQAATTSLAEALADKRCLVIVDDVWSDEHALAFAAPSRRSRVLFTTRDAAVLAPVGAQLTMVHRFDVDQALDVLAGLAPTARNPANLDNVRSILESTDRVPLAVGMVGAAVGRSGRTWESVAEELRESHRAYDDHPNAGAFGAIEAALAGLPGDLAGRYLDLGCFFEDARVPADVVATLWDVGVHDAETDLGRLSDAGLLRYAEVVEFHDLQRDFLLLGADRVRRAHRTLLDAFRPNDGSWAGLDAKHAFVRRHVVQHMLAAGAHDEAVATACDPLWIARRVQLDGSLAIERELRAVLRVEPSNRQLISLERIVRQDAHLLARAPRDDVAGTVASMLAAAEDVDLGRLELAMKPRWSVDRMSDELVRTIAHDDPVLALSPTQSGTVAVAVEGSTHRARNENAQWRVTSFDVSTGERLDQTAVIGAVAVSPDGRMVARRDGTQLSIHELNGDRLRRRIPGSGAGAGDVWLSPDGSVVVTRRREVDPSGGTVRSTVSFWDTEIGRPLGGITLNYDVRDVTWSADGRFAAPLPHVGGGYPVAHIIETAVSRRVRGVPATRAAISRDGTRFAFMAGRNQIKIGSLLSTSKKPVWDQLSSRVRNTFQVLQTVRVDGVHAASAVEWSPDMRHLAIGYPSGDVDVVRVEDGSLTASLTAHTDVVLSLAWFDDGNRLVSGGADRTSRVWSLRAAMNRDAMPIGDESRASPAWVVRSAAPNGRLLALGSASGVEIRRTVDGAVSARIVGGGGSVVWSPNSDRVMTGTHPLRLFDTTTGDQVGTVPSGKDRLRGTMASLSHLWHTDNTIQTLHENGLVRRWSADTESGEYTQTAVGRGVANPKAGRGIGRAVLSPNGALIAASSGTRVDIWAASGHGRWVGSPRPTASFAANDGTIIWAPNSDILAVGAGRLGRERNVRFFDARKSTELGVIPSGGELNCGAWSPDGTWFLVGRSDGVVEVWDWANADRVDSFLIGQSVSAIVWGAGGVIAACSPRRLIVFDWAIPA